MIPGNLSGGQKKLLELGRTMMVDAKIVFLDEVGAGKTAHCSAKSETPSSNSTRNATIRFVLSSTTWSLWLVYDPVICMAEGCPHRGHD